MKDLKIFYGGLYNIDYTNNGFCYYSIGTSVFYTSTFVKSSEIICLKCQTACSICSSLLACLSCPLGYYYDLLLDSCNIICSSSVTPPQAYYPDIITGQCKVCDITCNNCNGPYSSNCINCKTGTYFFALNSSCLLNCPYGYYSDGANCIRCSIAIISCSSCTNNSGLSTIICSTCTIGYLTLSGTCSSTCPLQTYADSITQKCQSCSINCNTCSGPAENECSTCAPGKYLLTSNQSCNSICPNSYYTDTIYNICILCNNSCRTCIGPSALNCQTCFFPNFLENSSCMAECSIGYYFDSSKIMCEICFQSCNSCSGPILADCKICPQGTFYSITGICITSLNIPSYLNFSNSTLIPCHSSCSSCYGPSEYECTSCYPGQYFLPKYGTCFLICPNMYTSNLNTGICEPCAAIYQGYCNPSSFTINTTTLITKSLILTTAFTIFPLSFHGSLSTFWSFFDIAQVTSYLLLINVIMPQNMVLNLKEFGYTGLRFLPNFISIIQDAVTNFRVKNYAPPNFILYGYTSYFLIDAGTILSTLALFSIIIAFIIIIKALLKLNKTKIQKILEFLTFTCLVRYLIISFMPLNISSFLQVQVKEMKEIYEYISIIIAYAILGLSAIIPIIMIVFFRKYSSILATERFTKKFGEFYKEFDKKAYGSNHFKLYLLQENYLFPLHLYLLTNFLFLI